MPDEAKPSRWRWPHPFFGAFAIAVGAGVIAGVTAPDTKTAYALDSSFVHRCEVGVAVGIVVYLVAIAGWLAWHGRYLPQLQGPGPVSGGGESQPVDPVAEPVEQTATEFNEFRKEVDRRFRAIENALGNVINRLGHVERGLPVRRENHGWRRITAKLRRGEHQERGNGR